MSRTTPTNRGRRIAIRVAVTIATILGGGLGMHFLIRAVIALHTP